MNFLNIEFFFFFNISCFLHVSCYFQHKKIKNWCKKQISGGGGGVFLEKQFFLISHFMLFSTLNKIETPVRPSIHHV